MADQSSDKHIGSSLYAVGAGIIADAGGFSRGLSPETAAGAASWLFIAFLPLAVIGCLAGWKTAKGT